MDVPLRNVLWMQIAKERASLVCPIPAVVVLCAQNIFSISKPRFMHVELKDQEILNVFPTLLHFLKYMLEKVDKILQGKVKEHVL